GRARVQRLRGAVHADAEGAVSLLASVPRPGGSATGDRRVHRAVQHRVDRGAPGVPDACPGTPRSAAGGRMRGYLAFVPVAACGSTGLYVRRESGDRVGPPLSGPRVQETGCGTLSRRTGGWMAGSYARWSGSGLTFGSGGSNYSQYRGS